MQQLLVEVRPSCLDCTRKHLAQALVLMQEAKQGYPAHRWIAIGHMGEAADECCRDFAALAAEIREHRTRYMADPDYDVPVMDLIERASALVKEESITSKQRTILQAVSKTDGDIRKIDFAHGSAALGRSARTWRIQMAALVKRGLVKYEIRREPGSGRDFEFYPITDAGRAALEEGVGPCAEMAAIDFKKIDLKAKYDDFNQRYFDGSLPADTKLAWGSLKHATGQTRATAKLKGPRPSRRLADLTPIEAEVSKPQIKMSTALVYDDAEFDKFFLHELVHLWLMYNGFALAEPHGIQFQKKLGEVSKASGLDLPMKHELTGAETLNPEAKTKEVGVFLVTPDEKHPEPLYLLFQLGAMDAFKARAEDYVSMFKRPIKLYKVATTAHAKVTVKRKPDAVGLKLQRLRGEIAKTLDLSPANEVHTIHHPQRAATPAAPGCPEGQHMTFGTCRTPGVHKTEERAARCGAVVASRKRRAKRRTPQTEQMTDAERDALEKCVAKGDEECSDRIVRKVRAREREEKGELTAARRKEAEAKRLKAGHLALTKADLTMDQRRRECEARGGKMAGWRCTVPEKLAASADSGSLYDRVLGETKRTPPTVQRVRRLEKAIAELRAALAAEEADPQFPEAIKDMKGELDALQAQLDDAQKRAARAAKARPQQRARSAAMRDLGLRRTPFGWE